MRDWDTDIAVMFYAPWCKYCKQLTPYMEQMAYQLKDNSNIMVGKFNCEEPASNNIVCQTIGVTHYPSVYFIGYGNFHQSPMGKLFGKSKFERIVHYRADLHPEAIYDWINMLKMISFIQRKWDDFLSIFNPSKSRTLRKIKTLENSISVLTATSEKYKSELESYKADELFDSLEDKGDPFPLLSSIPPDEVNHSIVYVCLFILFQTKFILPFL
jgi:thiol-disulfide isomerase/thioredoxin